MQGSTSAEEMIAQVSGLDRDALTREIARFQGRFRLDFTAAFLNSQTVEKLRHILLAALLTQSRSSV